MKPEFKILRKVGWDLNPDDKIVNSIIRALDRNGGHCPCHSGNEREHNICPCSAYVQHNKCYCTLYVLKEVWKDIKDFEGYYQISSFGRVKSVSRIIHKNDGTIQTFQERILTPYINEKRNEYTYVYLRKEGKKFPKFVHRLVAEAFIDNPDNLPQINHKDENPKNNRLDNLEWCDAKYNNNYGTKKDRMCINRSDRKEVAELDENGNIINTYLSIKQAALHFKINTKTIADICKGIKHPRIKLNLKFIQNN